MPKIEVAEVKGDEGIVTLKSGDATLIIKMDGLTFEARLPDGTLHSRRMMGNGESRDSVAPGSRPTSAYILTSMTAQQKGGWQNSHFHGKDLITDPKIDIKDPSRPGIREVITVISGWIAGADLMPDGEKVVTIYEANETLFTYPGIAHNLYQAPGAVTHCSKFGPPVGNPDEQRKGADWWPAPKEFDDWCRALTEDDIFKICKLSPDEIKKFAAAA